MRRRLFPWLTVQVARREIAEIAGKPSEAAFGVREGDSWLGFIEVRERSYGEGCETSPVGYIEALWVETDVRRRGVARAMVGAAIDWCRKRGLRELGSDAEISNVVSHAMHRRLGFEETERLVTYRMKLPPA
jgi:aminoglycoside 6'-N-acetyltransferase I